MKKLILITIVTMALCGCSDNEPAGLHAMSMSWRSASPDTNFVEYGNAKAETRHVERDTVLPRVLDQPAFYSSHKVPAGPAITNKYWKDVDYAIANRFASYRTYGGAVVGFTHPAARDSFEARLMANPELYRLFDLPSYAETQGGVR